MKDNRGVYVQMNHLPLCDDTNGVAGVDCVYTAGGQITPATYDDTTYPAKLPGPIYAPAGDYTREMESHHASRAQVSSGNEPEEAVEQNSNDTIQPA